MTNQEVLAEMQSLGIAIIEVRFDYDDSEDCGPSMRTIMDDGDEITLSYGKAYRHNGRLIVSHYVSAFDPVTHSTGWWEHRLPTDEEIRYSAWIEALLAPVHKDDDGAPPEALQGKYGCLTWNATDFHGQPYGTCRIAVTERVITYVKSVIDLDTREVVK